MRTPPKPAPFLVDAKPINPQDEEAQATSVPHPDPGNPLKITSPPLVEENALPIPPVSTLPAVAELATCGPLLVRLDSVTPPSLPPNRNSSASASKPRLKASTLLVVGDLAISRHVPDLAMLLVASPT
jgi:hypothetical protein